MLFLLKYLLYMRVFDVYLEGVFIFKCIIANVTFEARTLVSQLDIVDIVRVLVVLPQIVPEPKGGATLVTPILVESLLLPMTSALVLHQFHLIVVHSSAGFALKGFKFHKCCH